MARPARVDDAVPDVPAVLSGRVVRLMIVPPVHIFTIAAKRGDAMALDIEEPIATEEDLRAILPRWPGNASRKDLDRLNDVARAFIARTPYLVISSVGADGRHDISPKGDARGFVQVHDDKTLIIPDRLGDHRLDTFENLIAETIQHFNPARPIYIEDESRLIGSCRIPDGLFALKEEGERVELHLSKEDRIQRLVRDYGDADPQELADSVRKITKRLGSERAMLAIEQIEQGNLSKAFELVLHYYDRAYTRSV